MHAVADAAVFGSGVMAFACRLPAEFGIRRARQSAQLCFRRGSVVGYNVRPLQRDENSAFAEVCAECFYNVPRDSNGFRSKRIRAEILLSKWLRLLSPRQLESFAAVSASSGRICGVVEVTVEEIGRDSLVGLIIGGPICAYIQNLGVVLSERRKGLASQLMRMCECRARKWGYDELYLHVVEGNAAALQFYLSQGYSIVSRDASWMKRIGWTPLILLRKSLVDGEVYSDC